MPPPTRTHTRSRTRSRPRRRTALTALLAAVCAAATVLTGGASGTAAASGPIDRAAAQRVGNPYAGARVYVNPEWSANAASVPGGDAVADQPTAVWLDRIAAIDGADGGMGLREHLDAALAQGADLVQLVLYDLPYRNCDRPSPQGELGPDDLPRYRESFVEPIADILAEPAYAGLRIVTIVEPHSLSRLVTHTPPRHTSTPDCTAALESGAYVDGVGYALARLGALPNVYPYLDVSHHGWLGWDEEFHATARVLLDAATTAGSTTAAVHGFVSNVADYSVLDEPYLDVDDVVAGIPVHQSSWIDWNPYIDELPFVEAFREELVGLGFDEHVGMLVDTSRNGWGGPGRPTGPGSAHHVEEYVDQSRTDRRIVAQNWCNQAGSGLGERPTADPVPGVDAYVWAKPPGESDGSPLDQPTGPRREPMCDPTYLGAGANPPPTGALPDGPPAGEWFPEHFAELLRNAWPPLD
ncbi:glycoside hydrolase family 6 protein [Streptomyces sp. 4N509B]|uniref:glycoside hydrolase family 6 protein n=1 Tax=Streptomyces sp. 4N509B TaxID=3457413 RepID=UPI003FD02F31